MDADVIVVGSGFGGSVCALRAAESGMRVLVLERGQRMDAGAYERLADGRLPLLHRRDRPGLVEVHHLHRLAGICASATGGSSHLYTAVTIRAPREIFEHGWPRGLDHEAIQRHYDRVESTLKPAPLRQPPKRALRLLEIGERIGAEGVLLPLVVDQPHEDGLHAVDSYPPTLRGHITTILRGGGRCRKRTLDQTYLAAAQSRGATVLDLHEATRIEPIDGGYMVRFRRWENDDWISGELTARRIILSAGTFSTVKLLLTSRDVHGTLPSLSVRLGEQFYTNGDFGGLVVGLCMGLEADEGPPVTSWVDCWDTDRLYLMETGAFVGGTVWSMGVMGFEDAPGRLLLDRRGRLQHHFDFTASARFHARRVRRLREFAEAAGGKLLIAPDFMTRRMPATVHPLGGARMADRGDEGVVNSDGEVFGHPGLFIADGSVLPSPTGVAPSMTIAAVAEHIAERFVQHG